MATAGGAELGHKAAAHRAAQARGVAPADPTGLAADVCLVVESDREVVAQAAAGGDPPASAGRGPGRIAGAHRPLLKAVRRRVGRTPPICRSAGTELNCKSSLACGRRQAKAC